MTRGTLVVIAVVLLAALASVQAQLQMSDVNPNDVARSWLRARLAEEDRKEADIRASSHHSKSARSELASLPIPYTKKFYLTFGPYYVENPLSMNEQKNLRQFDEIDASWIIGR